MTEREPPVQMMSQTTAGFAKNLPQIKGENDMFANTLYRVKEAEEQVPKKSWKDGKLYKGNALSLTKDLRNDAYRLSEIKKILEEKNRIIKNQRNEIQLLKGALSNKKDPGYTTYGAGFKPTADADM